MRREPTDAEKKLWSRLRDRQLGGLKFRRQVPFGGFVLDYYCTGAMLAVELDGGQHAEPAGQRYDAGRDAALLKLGVVVLRFPDDEALKETDAVLEKILGVGRNSATAGVEADVGRRSHLDSERPLTPALSRREREVRPWSAGEAEDAGRLPPSPSGRARG